MWCFEIVDAEHIYSQQSFNGQRLPSLQIPSPAGSPYSPAAITAALSAQNNQTARTVYVGNLPATASVDELLNLVHFGPLESIRVLPEKSCVFLSFLDGATAAAFHADALIKKLSLHGQELKIGWGKPSPVPSQVALAIQQSNASRNVYLGGLDEVTTEEQLRDDLSRFGLIDQVKIVRDKNIGFVHFLSISTATERGPAAVAACSSQRCEYILCDAIESREEKRREGREAKWLDAALARSGCAASAREADSARETARTLRAREGVYWTGWGWQGGREYAGCAGGGGAVQTRRRGTFSGAHVAVCRRMSQPGRSAHVHSPRRASRGAAGVRGGSTRTVWLGR